MSGLLPPAPYRVRLPAFEGPLDLLLHLIRAEKLNVHDIPISRITAQYLGHLDLMRELNLEVAGEFIVMAATLMQIKARMLLPRDPSDAELDEEDPRTDLVQRLIEYEQYRQAGLALRERLDEFEELFPREGTAKELAEIGAEVTYEFRVSLFELLAAFKGILERAEKAEGKQLLVMEFNVKQRMVEIMEDLRRFAAVRLETLIGPQPDRRGVLLTFLALLELVRLRAIWLRQTVPCGPIYVRIAVREEEQDGD